MALAAGGRPRRPDLPPSPDGRCSIVLLGALFGTLWPARTVPTTPKEEATSTVFIASIGAVLSARSASSCSPRCWCASASPSVRPDHESLQRTMADLRVLTSEALEGVRRMALELRPTMLDDLGLVAAVEAFARQFSQRTGIPLTSG